MPGDPDPDSPDFAWIDDMFKPVLFPTNISFNSIVSETFESDDIIVDSGVSQRTPRWKYPLHEADVAFAVRTMEELHALKQFWRIVHGTQYGFLFNNPFDFTSNFAKNFDSRSAPQITAIDQVIGTGDGATTQFQLSKTYTYKNVYDNTDETHVKPIYRPQPNTTIVSLDGVQQFSGWSVDVTTGIVTFTSPPGNGVIIKAGFWYWLTMRFNTKRLPLALEAYGIGQASEVKLVEILPAETA